MNNRQREEEASVLLDRPPPEPPPWSAGESRVWKHHFNFTVCLRYIFHYQAVYFSVGYFYYYKTLALGLSEVWSTSIVYSSGLPINGSTSYIACLKVINSKSGSRVDGCLWFLTYFIPFLNANALISI
ncbi:unnamed protein product [Cuscuta epithymum]|uniref:Uncharacterized protein n=1 Tax=Cuscuta epithymum TaxID=186058 RepID=A0AAV0FVH8_9ASTE|nr:unnamed protein product [Cuscuta epithymum]